MHQLLLGQFDRWNKNGKRNEAASADKGISSRHSSNSIMSVTAFHF